MIEIIQTGQDQNSRGEFSRQCFEIGSGLTSDSDVKEIVEKIDMPDRSTISSDFRMSSIETSTISKKHPTLYSKIFVNEKKTESDELQDIIRLIDNIRNGQAEPSQELSIVSRTLQLIRLIKTQREEANITELAFLLQACRG